MMCTSQSGFNWNGEIRSAVPSHYTAAQVVDLSNSIYARKITVEYVYWQFFDCAFPAQLLLALDGKAICGYYGIQVFPLRIGSDKRSIARALDVMVLPDFRKRGIFSRLELKSLSAVSNFHPISHIVFANALGFQAWSRRGWSLIKEITTYCCETSPAPRGINMMRYQASAVSIRQCAYFGPEIDQVWKRFCGGHPELVGIERGSLYLNWRFAHNPRYRYHLFTVERASSPVGYLVLKVFRDPLTGESYGDIVDLMWSEDSEELLVTMLSFALSYFHSQGVAQAATWLESDTLLSQVGKQLGFKETGQKRYFCCKIMDERYTWLNKPACWFITMADSEVF
jgi:GNAT superfamily N-acetyltransferase